MLYRYLCVIVCLALLLAACGPTPVPQATPFPSPTGPTLPSGDVSFMVSGDPAEKAAYEKIVAGFNQKYPDVKVQLIHVPSSDDYTKRLAADFAAGTPADIIMLNYRAYANFAARGLLQPLGPYMTYSPVIQATQFYTQALAPFYWRGVLTCIPQNLSSPVIYYNKALFDAAKLNYPQSNWTWDDFLATAKALTLDTNGDGATDQYGLSIEPTIIRAAPFIWQNGGELVFNPGAPTRLSLDKPEGKAALQWFIDLQLVHHVVPPLEEAKSEDAETRFLNGRAAMYMDSRRFVPTARESAAFDWDVAGLPRGRQAASILHSDGYCMPAMSKNKQAAWALIEYANSVEGQTIIAATGRTVPSLRQVAESPAFLDPAAKPANSQAWLDAIAVMHSVPTINTWPDVEDVINSELERAFYGQVSLDGALTSTNARVVEFLKLAVELQPTPLPNPSGPTPTPLGGAGLPPCASKVATVALIQGFPSEFPWPNGTVFLQSYDYPETNGFYALGVIPARMEDVIKYYQDNLVTIGYTLAPGDAEPGEVDLRLAGGGRAGNMRTGVPLGCEEVTIIEILLENPQ
jgi:multiple sugar transport system substrate-binding protein